MDSPTLDSRADVLVVGAGPVGLAAALTLRERGARVRIIDEQASEQKRTYPVILHPRTLRILESLGVTAPLEWRGHVIRQLAVYTDGQRREVLDLPAGGSCSPGALTLPQDVLRQALSYRLSELGVRVEWKTRLLALEQGTGRVRSTLVRRERVEGEAPELRPEWFDVASATTESAFVVGADGVHSLVRDKLGIGWRVQAPRQVYAFYDVPDARAGSEAHLALEQGLGSTVYPLQSGISRFSFQLSIGTTDAPGLAQLQQLWGERLPWYGAPATSYEWSHCVEFSPALAERFGEGRIWLAGDSAHSTGPLGGQSLNVGIHEAHDLGRRMAEELDSKSAAALGDGYEQQRRVEWQVLFSLAPRQPYTQHARDWVTQNLPLLVQALPGAGDDLDALLEQLQVRAA